MTRSEFSGAFWWSSFMYFGGINMSEVAENKNSKSGKPDGLLGADEKSQEIKLIYDFVNFVYGKSNTERLSKIIDKVVKEDMKFFEDKTDEEITSWQSQKNPNYEFKNSLYAEMKKEAASKLVEPMLWHMALIDILNLKCYDLNSDEPLEESIKDAIMQKSNDRLDFLCGNHGLDFNYVNDYGELLYKYSKRVFEDLPTKKGINLQSECLMRKIFACFTKVAFCKMKQSAQLECYKNARRSYDDYRYAIDSLKNRFYLQVNPYDDRIKAVEKDIATYLFLIGELEIMFNSYGDDFFKFFGIDCGPVFKEYLFFLNEIEPLENQYRKDKKGFIKKYFPIDLITGLWDEKIQSESILPYFKDKKLRSSLMKDLKKRFNKIKFDQIEESKSGIEENWKRTNYFCDIINRFTDGQKYSNELVENMSVMLCQEKDNFIDIQRSSQKNNEEEKNEKEQAGAEKENKEKQNMAKDETKNSGKNYFFRFVCAVLNFFRSIGSKIINFFCRQPKKIDNVGGKNNSFVSNIKDIKSQDPEVLETDNLDTAKQKNIQEH